MARKKTSTKARALRVSGEMNIYRVNELAQELFAIARDSAGEACIDLSQVTEFDTAGLQLLLMVRRIAQAHGTTVRLVNPAECIKDVLTLCNLSELVATAAR